MTALLSLGVKMNERIFDQKIWILEEAKDAVINGLPVKINGIPYGYHNLSTLDEILLLKEEETYMKDYVGDDSGKIVEIAFDTVKLTK